MQCCAGFQGIECELYKTDCPGYSGVRTLCEHAIKIGFSKNKRTFCLNLVCPFIIWQDSLEVNPNVLIGSFLVGILPYGPFPWKRSMLCIFLVFESRAGKFKLRKENVQILSSSQRNYLKDWYFTELTIKTRNTNIHEANFIILKI